MATRWRPSLVLATVMGLIAVAVAAALALATATDSVDSPVLAVVGIVVGSLIFLAYVALTALSIRGEYAPACEAGLGVSKVVVRSIARTARGWTGLSS